MQEQLDGGGIAAVAVGFSPPSALAALGDHVGWHSPFLSDEERVLYRSLGLGRAPVWRVYSPRTLLRYAAAVLQGRRLTRPVEDTRQLGGDALVLDGHVVAVWRPRTPEDRVAAATLAQRARQLAADQSDDQEDT